MQFTYIFPLQSLQALNISFINAVSFNWIAKFNASG